MESLELLSVTGAVSFLISICLDTFPGVLLTLLWVLPSISFKISSRRFNCLYSLSFPIALFIFSKLND